MYIIYFFRIKAVNKQTTIQNSMRKRTSKITLQSNTTKTKKR